MNTILISKDSLLSNFTYLRSLVGQSAIFPVLKSNAYGHGLKEVAEILDESDAPYLVVDSLPEYFIAKKYTQKKFLLLGETTPINYNKFSSDRVALTIYNPQTFKHLLDLGKRFKVHLFLNTGMNREGLQEKDLYNLLELSKTHKNGKLIEIEGVLSHLVESENHDKVVTNLQIDRFKKMYSIVIGYGHAVKRKHIGNSGAIFSLDDKFFNAWRSGLSLYGYSPLDDNNPHNYKTAFLRPALRVLSHVISVHDINKGDGVSYNHRRHSKQNTRIATIPFGYKEGLPRSASGKIFFNRKGNVVPQIGTICMNMCSFDCGKNVSVGDEVEIVSSNTGSQNSLYALAQSANTVVWECLVRLDPMIRRQIIDK